MKHDPRLAPLQPPLSGVPAKEPKREFGSFATAHAGQAVDGPIRIYGDESDCRLWALGLIATCSNQSVLFGEVPLDERVAAAREVLRLSRLPNRTMK